MSRSQNLRRLLYPRTIAFVGGRGLTDTIKQSGRFGFDGDIWVVNPNRSEIAGRKCFARIEDLPAPPDAAFIGVSREATVSVVKALAARGAGGCVCFAAGYAESGAEGIALERQLRAAAGTMALVGPNCYGLLNYLDRVALFPAPYEGGRPQRGVAIVSQSGNVSLNLTLNDRSLPLAFVISAGNQAVLRLEHYIEALVDDGRVLAIGLYVEGIRDVAGFARAARRALAAGIPIVALKVGTSRLGEQITLSHTSSVSGPEELHRALFRRLAIPLVDSLPALLETLKLFAVNGPLSGRRLGVLTASGGDATLIADLADREGFTIPPLGADQAENLRSLLSSFAAISNPLDYNNPLWGDREGMERCFTTMMQGAVDLTLMVLDCPRSGAVARHEWDASVGAFIAAKEATGAPAAVVSTLPESLPRDVRDRLAAAAIAPLQGIDGLAAALRSAAWYREVADTAAGRPQVAQPAPIAGKITALDEWQTKRCLAELGLAVPAGRLVAWPDASDAAAELGYPVVAKAVHPGLTHKTEVEAVRLNLRSRDQVRDAVTELERLAETRGWRTFLLERMVDDVIAELLIGVKRDPRFGFSLALGSGGVFVGLVDDHKTLLLPTHRDEVASTIDSLRIGRLIDGYRGARAGDREAAIEGVMTVAAYVERNRERLVELEINPLAVLQDGRGVVVLDARICVA